MLPLAARIALLRAVRAVVLAVALVNPRRLAARDEHLLIRPEPVTAVLPHLQVHELLVQRAPRAQVDPERVAVVRLELLVVQLLDRVRIPPAVTGGADFVRQTVRSPNKLPAWASLETDRVRSGLVRAVAADRGDGVVPEVEAVPVHIIHVVLLSRVVEADLVVVADPENALLASVGRHRAEREPAERDTKQAHRLTVYESKNRRY